MKSQISSDAVPPPSGPYSNGILVDNLLFIAGQGPFDASGRLVGSTFEDQLNKTVDNLELILKAAGVGLDSIVKLSVFIRNIENRPALNAILASRLEQPYPARTTVPADLNGFEVEIDAVAHVPSR
jgi:2-iminobutanoate/2-iminopropanoate deaminase